MLEQIQDYYGKTLQSSADLQTDACCTPDQMPGWLREGLAKIHPEVSNRYYGCGLAIPEGLAGLDILDLGSGAGRDVFLASGLVGSGGSVTGVDATDEQLAVANAHIGYHTEAYGYARPNVRFLKGDLQDLAALGLDDSSFDLIISNCVINLVDDKEAIWREAFRLLKPGGELYFSDVYADRRVPDALKTDPVLRGECLSGALYWQDFHTQVKAAGFSDPRLVEGRILGIHNADVAAKLGDMVFYSSTYRLFKVADLEPSQEDYGHMAEYLGTLAEAPASLVLDADNVFPKGQAVPISGNTARLIEASRLAEHFQVTGDFSRHLGGFTQGAEAVLTSSPSPVVAAASPGGCCG